jgi:hypothetical protein
MRTALLRLLAAGYGKADLPMAPSKVCFRGQSGHGFRTA